MSSVSIYIFNWFALTPLDNDNDKLLANTLLDPTTKIVVVNRTVNN